MTLSNVLAADHRQHRNAYALLAVVALAVMSLLGYLIWSGYWEAIHEAETKTRNYAAIIGARLDATLRRADATLLERVSMIPVAALSKQALPDYARDLNAGLDFRMTNFPELDGLRIFDANGDQLYSSDRASTSFTNIAERAYFQKLRDNPRAGLVFSEVVIAYTTGRPSVFMSRAVRDGQGAFRGVVIAGLHLKYFQDLFQSLDVGDHGVIGIRRTDDSTSVVRWPQGSIKLNTPLPPGTPIRAASGAGERTATAELTSSTDGIARIYSFHALDRYPFFVTVGMARDDVLAGWRMQALAVGLSGLLLLGLLAGLLIRLWRAQAGQALAMTDLAKSEERFRALFEHVAVGVTMTEIATGRLVRVNRKYADILGYSPEEILQKDFRSLTHPDDLPAHLAAREPFMAGAVNEFTVEKRYLRKDRSVMWARLTVSQMRLPGQAPTHHIGVLEDITERKQGEAAQARLAAIVNSSNDAIIGRTLDGTIVSWNPAAERLFGWTAAETIGRSASIIVPPDREEEVARNRAQIAQGGGVRDLDTERLTKDGRRIPVSLTRSMIYDSNGAMVGASLMFRDITERKLAEQALARENYRNQVFLRNSSDGVHILDADGNVLEVSDSFCEMLGYAREELIGANVSLWDAQWSPQELKQVIAEQMAKEDRTVFETRHRRRDGSLLDVEITGQHLELDGKTVLFNSARDITDRKRAQESLRESEQELRAMFDGALDGILVADVETRKFLTANVAICRMLGYTHEEILRIGVSDIHPKQDLPRVAEQFEKQLRGEIQMGANTPMIRKDGSVFYADIKAAPIRLGGKDRMLGIFRDTTERKQAERELVESEARFRSLVEQSIAGTYIIQDGKFAYVNPRFAEIFAYASAGEIIGREAVSLVAESDRDSVAENVRLRTEGETASINYDFTGVRKDGLAIDVGVHGARAVHRGRPAVIGLIQDISEKKRAEERIRHYIAQLETAFMSTVEVATTLSEMRDPYTAGHERRVADIAVAIGAELGFDARRQEGLRVAGHLHDVGKITIPSEILSKPGKLTAIEFQLIKQHAQASYDVLKEVKFSSWPVAQIALQHHERMDGSGYPQGLKGEAILLEARIVAVADVVEAMSSHRPYRPGLGIEKALAEIERGRGTAYDADAADACLRLFREKRFQLPA